MKFVTRENDYAVVYLEQHDFGVRIVVSGWHVATLLNDGRLMLTGGICTSNDEGLQISEETGVIVTLTDRELEQEEG